MAEFGASATLMLEVDQASKQQVRREIEDDLGPIPVDVTGGAGVASAPSQQAAQPDGGMGMTGLGQAGTLEELRDQTEIQEDMLEELETLSGMGGGGGGGLGLGGVGLGFGLSSAMGGLGLSGALGGIGTTGAAGIGLGTGLAGVNVLDQLGVFEGLEGLGEDARGLPGGDIAGDFAQFIPGASIAAGLPGLATLDLDRASEDFSQIWENRGGVLENIGQPLFGPPGGLESGVQSFLAGGGTDGGERSAMDNPLRNDAPNVQPFTTAVSDVSQALEDLPGEAPSWLSNIQRLLGFDGGGGGGGSGGVSPGSTFGTADTGGGGPSIPVAGGLATGLIGGTSGSGTSGMPPQGAFGPNGILGGGSGTSGNRAQQQRQQQSRVDATVNNQVELNLDISNARELEALLQDPERWIRRNTSFSGRLTGGR